MSSRPRTGPKAGTPDAGVDLAEAAPTATTLRGAALNGVFWTFGQKWGARVVTFIVYAALGRLLDPTDFGTIAVAAAFATYVGLLVDFGLPLFVVQSQTFTERARDTIFWLGQGFAAVLTVVQIALAQPLADWMGNPQVADILRVLALAYPLGSVAGLQMAINKRRLRFKLIAIRGLVAVAASGAIALAMAVAGLGAWALVGQTLSFILVSVIVLWMADPWWPRLRFEPEVAREALAFGVKALGTMALDAVSSTADTLVIGRRLGVAAVGSYAMATRMVQVATDTVVSVVFSVANPLFAKAKSDRPLLRAAYTRSVTQALVVSSSTMGVLAATFGPVLELVVGPKWLPAATAGSLLTVAQAIRVPIWFDRSLLYALGKPGTELTLNVIDTGLLLAAVLFGSSWGIAGVGWGLVMRAVLMWPLRLVISCRLTDQRWQTLGLRQIRIWLAAAVGSVTAWASIHAMPDQALAFSIAVAALVGLTCFMAAAAIIAKADVAYTIRTAQDVFLRRRRAVAT